MAVWVLKGRLRCGFVCGRFHHNAFFASRALHIADSTNSSLVYPLLEHIFANQVWIHWYGLGRLTHFSLCIFFFGSSSPTLPLLRFLRLFCQTENDARIKSHVCCATMSLSRRIYMCEGFMSGGLLKMGWELTQACHLTVFGTSFPA